MSPQVDKLLHGVYTNVDYAGVEKRPEHAGREIMWQISARRSTYKQLSESKKTSKE